MCHGQAKIFVRIHRRIVDTYFVVQMGTGGTAPEPDEADGIAAVHMLPGDHREFTEVAVAGGNGVTVVEDDDSSISTEEVGKLDDSIGGAMTGCP